MCDADGALPPLPPRATLPAMSDTALAIAEHDQAITTPRTARRQRISPRVRDACDLLASKQCKTITDAAAAVGLTREHLSRELSKPHVQVFLQREARRTITNAAMRASYRVVELLDASSEHVSLDAAKHVLGINGIKPAADAQVSVSIDIKAGYVIDLSDTPGDRAKVVEGHTTSTDVE